MRKYLISLCLFFALAAYPEPQIRVVQLSGEDYEAAVSTIGRFVLRSDSLMIISTQGDKLAAYPMSELRVLDLSHVATALQQLPAQLSVRFEGDLMLTQLEKPTTLRLFSSSGQLMRQVEAPAGLGQLNLAGLPSGVYLLQANTDIVKLIKY